MFLDSGANIYLVSKDVIRKEDNPEYFRMIQGVEHRPVRIPYTDLRLKLVFLQ